MGNPFSSLPSLKFPWSATSILKLFIKAAKYWIGVQPTSKSIVVFSSNFSPAGMSQAKGEESADKGHLRKLAWYESSVVWSLALFGVVGITDCQCEKGPYQSLTQGIKKTSQLELRTLIINIWASGCKVLQDRLLFIGYIGN